MVSLALFYLWAGAPVAQLRVAEPVQVLDLHHDRHKSLSLVFKNEGKIGIQYWSTRFSINHRVEAYTLTGVAVPRTQAGFEAARSFGSRRRDRNFPILVLPGKSHTYKTDDIADWFAWSPGRYLVRIWYQDRSFGAQLQLSSPLVVVTVTD